MGPLNNASDEARGGDGKLLVSSAQAVRLIRRAVGDLRDLHFTDEADSLERQADKIQKAPTPAERLKYVAAARHLAAGYSGEMLGELIKSQQPPKT